MQPHQAASFLHQNPQPTARSCCPPASDRLPPHPCTIASRPIKCALTTSAVRGLKLAIGALSDTCTSFCHTGHAPIHFYRLGVYPRFPGLGAVVPACIHIFPAFEYREETAQFSPVRNCVREQGRNAHAFRAQLHHNGSEHTALLPLASSQRISGWSPSKEGSISRSVYSRPLIIAFLFIHSIPPQQYLLSSILCFPAVSVLIDQPFRDHAFQNAISCRLAHIKQLIHIPAHDRTI